MIKFVSIKDKYGVEEHSLLLSEFEEIYNSSFPENEREPFQNIIERIYCNNKPITSIKLVTYDNKCIGGIVMDYYPECNVIEPIYFVVMKNYRNHGIGKKLFNSVVNEYENINHLIFEVDDPQKVKTEESAMDPTQRLNMYLKWGFNIIPINYIQPPLSEDKDWENNLLLLHKGEILTKDELKSFLKYFYLYLGYGEECEALQSMYKEIEELNIEH